MVIFLPEGKVDIDLGFVKQAAFAAICVGKTGLDYIVIFAPEGLIDIDLGFVKRTTFVIYV